MKHEREEERGKRERGRTEKRRGEREKGEERGTKEKRRGDVHIRTHQIRTIACAHRPYGLST